MNERIGPSRNGQEKEIFSISDAFPIINQKGKSISKCVQKMNFNASRSN